MLGKTAGGLFWMCRYLERSASNARLIEAGSRMTMTRAAAEDAEWASVLESANVRHLYAERHESIDRAAVIDFLLRDKTNPSSVMSVVEAARNNARMVRVALTREVWEAVNDTWMKLKDALARQVSEKELPNVLELIRQQSAQVRGALHGTMLRNDIFNFCRIGTFLERTDNVARILDVKYYVLLPSVSMVGSTIDNYQWEAILRSAAAERSFAWLNKETGPRAIAEFLILDQRLPRSLAFCYINLARNLGYLEADYGETRPCMAMCHETLGRLTRTDIETILQGGLHEFIQSIVQANNALGLQIEKDYRFYA
ncbi:alpha-E domain-containing protein [Henriciella aquimarina]|uniref:alpha-E domain-containing protein n=1 Tax=Henriciella aquimarina TaxID=545261 RepID=UPI000A034085